MKKATEMTIEEFKDELARLREETLQIRPLAPNEAKAANRSYRNQKRGNFFNARLRDAMLRYGHGKG